MGGEHGETNSKSLGGELVSRCRLSENVGSGKLACVVRVEGSRACVCLWNDLGVRG